MPQVILPFWTDLYNQAALAENMGVGVWGCKNTAPDWTVSALAEGILHAVNDGPMRDRARALGDRISAGEKGRDIGAREIARLMS